MIALTPLYQRILTIVDQKEGLRSSQIHTDFLRADHDVSLVTIKRALSTLIEAQYLSTTGAGRSITYALSTRGRVFMPVNVQEYCALEPDERHGMERFNFHLLPELPDEFFSEKEKEFLRQATEEFVRRKKTVTPIIAKKEMERLVIELSWKSSKIEGNTYTLLETERLIRDHQKAAGHRKEEAQMILNHKEAFLLIHDHSQDFRTLTRANVDHLHSLLTHNLKVGRGLRTSPVGITGSRYRPLDTVHQLSDALQSLTVSIRKMRSPYGKSLLALLGISYIQPFEDGNKRTARLMADAILLAYRCAPLSYRSVNEEEYRNATITFYERNSIVPFKKIFIEQYDFAARNYAVK